MAVMALSCDQIKLGQPSGLLVSNHMQAETPLQFPINSLPPPEIIEKVPKSMLPFSSFNSIPVYLALVLVQETAIDMHVLFRPRSHPIDGIKCVIDDSVTVHRY